MWRARGQLFQIPFRGPTLEDLRCAGWASGGGKRKLRYTSVASDQVVHIFLLRVPEQVMWDCLRLRPAAAYVADGRAQGHTVWEGDFDKHTRPRHPQDIRQPALGPPEVCVTRRR